MKKNVFVLLFVITIIIGIATPAFAERLKYTGLARSEGGAVLASATVAVYLAGTTTPADVYEASSGGTSVNEVTTDSNGRWTFYADTTDYAFTQEYKVVVTKDGYSSITLDNIFILRLPTNAVGVLYNDGSGNYSWGSSLSSGGITLADASTLTLPAAAPTAEGLPITCNNSDSTCSFATGFSSITIGGGTASTVAVWDGSQNLSSLTSQNMVTTGQVDGRVKVVVATDTVTIDASASNQTVFYINGANSARTFNLPAAVAGLAYCFSNALYAQALTVDPAAGDKIILAGVAADAGEYVESTSAAATDKICVLAIDTEYWLVTASTGTWAQDTP